MTSTQKQAAELLSEWEVAADFNDKSGVVNVGNLMAALLRQIASMGGDVEPVAWANIDSIIRGEPRHMATRKTEAEYFNKYLYCVDPLFTQQAIDAARLAGFEAGREHAAAEAEARIFELSRALLDAEAAGYAKGKTEAAELALSIGRAGGVEEAAAHLERLAKEYADEFGSNDMGSLSFGQGDQASARHEYYYGLLELADELRKLKDKAKGPADALERATCAWKPHGDENMPGTWESGCGGALWTFEHDGPIENGVKFCMSCGKPALVVKDE